MSNSRKYQQLKRKCQALKVQCPMPVLLAKLGLAAYAKRSCPSPFRTDQTPSWGIFPHQGGWYFKDHATDDSGDELTLVARLKGWDERRDFKRIVEFYEETAKKENPAAPLLAVHPPQPSPESSNPPDLSGYSAGTDEQLIRLSVLRSISVPALRLATERGFLMFGVRFNSEVFGLKDQSGRLAEVRRLDGQLFPAFGSFPQHKSHTVKGSCKGWPLGLGEAASAPSIVLLEGLPDFLAAFDFMLREGKANTVAPVTMLAASASIEEGALSHFHNKRVRMFPHYDPAGLNAAQKWTEQLTGIAANIDYFQFSDFPAVKDLADLNAALNAVPPTATINESVLP
ncbi:MAG: hypothetical protein EBS84_21245 [Proteobacteria bacterium]|nr:hypothetical protein [Verrucomicrobiota bacterium]NBU11499.1 hypothetical protein [Pseudomonadota bacterium]